jgi:hypothetical protein
MPEIISPPVIASLPPRVSGPFTDIDSGAAFYTVSIDASGSWSPAFSPDQLTFAWSDAFSGLGTLPSYSMVVTTAQLAGATTTPVTVTVADPLGTATTTTIVVMLTATATPTIVVGKNNGATYSADNGATWTTFGSSRAMVPIREPPGLLLAAFSDQTIQSSTKTLYTFPAPPSAFFVNPANASRLTVGLGNGEVWRSINGGATWALLTTFGALITQVVEASDGLLTYVVSGTTIWLSRRAFLDKPVEWIKYTTPVRATCMVLGKWGNYAGASDGTVTNVGTGQVLADLATAITRMAYHPRHGTLWVVESSGAFWRMKQGDSVLSQIGTIPGGGGRLAPITPIPGALLNSNDAGAFLSPDAGVTWHRILSGPAYSIGYSGLPVPGTY